MKIQEVSSLIALRQYANNIIDNTRVKLSRDEINRLEAQIVNFDKKIVKEIIELELNDDKNEIKEFKATTKK